MKAANVALAGLALALAGCAANRPYSPGAERSGGPSTIPDTTPELGNPAEGIEDQGEPSSLFKGGPTFRMPEALRNESLPRSPRLSQLKTLEREPRTSRYRPEPFTDPISASDRALLRNEPGWSRFYRSTDRRPVETLVLGNGPRRIAILGSLHGDETQSVALVEELARHLKAHPELFRRISILLVKSPNPDGHFARTPYNVNGVDLNRNFPSSNWKDLANARSGMKPASEAETRVMMRLLKDFQPALIVHLKDARDAAVVNREGPIDEFARQVAQQFNGRLVDGLGARTSGSLEHFALTQLRCPSLTVLLPREASDSSAWARHRDSIVALLNDRASGNSKEPTEPKSRPEEDATHPFDQPAMRQSSLRKPRTTQEKQGSAEPRSVNRTRNKSALPEFSAEVPDTGYIELPPP
jgi:murein peptide amidase A